MKRYGQFCPVAKAAELFCERWTPLIIRDLSGGPLGFADLQRGVPLMSPSLLSRRLKQLRAERVVEQVKLPGNRRALYALTEAGRELSPIVEALGTWGQRWTRRELVRGEIDLGLFIWAFQRSVNPRALGAERSVVELTLADQPRAKRQWWFVNDGDRVDLCLEDPGFEIDIYAESTLPEMIRVWRGDVGLREALEDGRVSLHGRRGIRRKFVAWFGISTLAGVGPASGR